MSKFKIGDEVMVICNASSDFDGVEIGDIGIVIGIKANEEEFPIGLRIRKHGEYWFKEKELELVTDRLIMTITSQSNGYGIYYDKSNKWKYIDNDEEFSAKNKRDCIYCGKPQTIEGHDGCLGTLIGVKNACCGHGGIDNCYVQFLDGESIHGEDAKVILNILKKYRKDEKYNES